MVSQNLLWDLASLALFHPSSQGSFRFWLKICRPVPPRPPFVRGSAGVARLAYATPSTSPRTPVSSFPLVRDPRFSSTLFLLSCSLLTCYLFLSIINVYPFHRPPQFFSQQGIWHVSCRFPSSACPSVCLAIPTYIKSVFKFLAPPLFTLSCWALLFVIATTRSILVYCAN